MCNSGSDTTIFRPELSKSDKSGPRWWLWSKSDDSAIIHTLVTFVAQMPPWARVWARLFTRERRNPRNPPCPEGHKLAQSVILSVITLVFGAERRKLTKVVIPRVILVPQPGITLFQLSPLYSRTRAPAGLKYLALSD